MAMACFCERTMGPFLEPEWSLPVSHSSMTFLTFAFWAGVVFDLRRGRGTGSALLLVAGEELRRDLALRLRLGLPGRGLRRSLLALAALAKGRGPLAPEVRQVPSCHHLPPFFPTSVG